MNTALPEHIRRFIEQEVESGRFADEQQVIVTALEWMAGDHRIAPDVLAELIAEPLAQIERGEGKKWSPELHERIRERAARRTERHRKVRDEIKY
ncbi:MAG: hypothetical protein M3440_12095 [Chloroflexota bacterium]|nr:hypothetical protein [Chloroflexota bacterium]